VLAVSARPALILLNLHFGTGLDGIEVARRLKADPRTAAIPLVAFTALTEREVELEAKRLGFAAFLTKPFDATTLRETVRRYVRQG
jgi:CheY-like chemotaxis protein